VLVKTMKQENEIRDPTQRGAISVYPNTWAMVNSEKRYKECMDDVINRVFKEWKELKLEIVKQAERDIIKERLEKIDDIKEGDF
jgi:hypothetical protein